MKITVVHPGDLGRAEVARWRDLQHSNRALGNPFLSPEFTLAVGRARDTARVAVLSDGPRIVGFFPYERRGRFVGTVIGAGISDCQGLVHAPGLDWDAMALIRACGLPVWEFDHLMVDQAPFTPYHRIRVRSPIMDLSRGFAHYVDTRRRAANGAIATIGRKMRKLEREVGPLRLRHEITDGDALRVLMRWKSAQYRRTRVHDRFATPWIVDVVTELLGAGTAECTGSLSVLYAGDRPVAAHFGLRSDAVLAYWFPAYDADFSRYSAGLGLLLRLAEAAAAQGVDHIDLGRGDSRYKDELGSRELVIAEGRVGPSRPVAAVRRAQGAFAAGVRQVRLRCPLRHVRRFGRYVRGRTG